jgi:peptidoglycan hydrolase CwlO-like protein
LQNQYASFAKVKDDLQAQVDDLSRSNRDKSTMINSLQNSLTAAQERLAKSGKAATPMAATMKSGAAKPSAKVKPKAPAKKKTSAKTTGAR